VSEVLSVILFVSQGYPEETAEKGDILTAFGCINYAHGLLDALIKLR
jgi:hypothetical protein